jgi:nicotinamide-nucleotide amidase
MVNNAAHLQALAQQLGAALLRRKLMCATAESCTGGMVAAAITGIAGASDWFDRGFVTYSNAAKHDMLGVPLELIEQHGAVSDQVARAMAEGALAHSQAQMAISITGIAGPGGGTLSKPVGLVWFGIALRGVNPAFTVHTQQQRFDGDRASVREQAAAFAIQQGIATISS